MDAFTRIIVIRKQMAYRIGARGSCSAAEAIRGPPMRNQNMYTLGFRRLVSTPRLKDPVASSSVFPGSGGSREKHSSPILVKNNAPRSEIENRTDGCVAIQPARSRLTIISGPSVKIGAAAVHIPAFRPLERDSLITIVRSGPGLMPSMIQRAIPAAARLAIRSVSIHYLEAAILARSLRISR